MRTGAELVRASQVFAKEDPATTWRLFLSTVAVHAGLIAFVVLAPPWPFKLLGSVLMGFTLVRLFIFYHDYLHGAIFRDSVLGRWCMYLVGLYTLAAPSVWKETHDYHHRNNAKILGSAIGSYPLVTVGIYRGLTPNQRRAYRAIRHPLTIALGLFTSFMVGMCLAPFRRAPKVHWQGPLTLALYLAIAAAVWATLGWQMLLFLVVIPGVLSAALGSYLFYAQHNFPDAEIRGRRDWEFTHAALKCSSYFEMSSVMHWLTGNIGYHHVHHLNHRIPFYRLPEAMAAMPELQSPGRTSWHPRDIWACLQVALWDTEQKRLVTFREAEEILARKQAEAVAAK